MKLQFKREFSSFLTNHNLFRLGVGIGFNRGDNTMSNATQERFTKQFSLGAVFYVLTGFDLVGPLPGTTLDRNFLMEEVALLRIHLELPNKVSLRGEVATAIGEDAAVSLVDNAAYIYLLTTFIVTPRTLTLLNRIQCVGDAKAHAELYVELLLLYGERLEIDGYTE